MAAPALGSVGTHIAGSGSTASFAVPAGVASGDIIVIPIFIDGEATITAMPAGFAHAEGSPVSVPPGGAHSLAVAWKRATGADTGIYNFTLSAGNYRAGAALRYTGCAATGSPWDTPTDTALETTSGTITPPVDITTAGPDRLLVFAGTNWAGGAWTPPAGFTERIDAGDRVHTAADRVQAVAGNTGSVTATCAGSDKRTAWLGALIGTTGGGATHAGSASGASTSTGSAVAGRLTAATATGAAVSTGTALATAQRAASAVGGSISGGTATAAIPSAGGVTHSAAALGSSTSGGTAAVALRLAAGAAGGSTSAGSAVVTLRHSAAASASATSAGTADAGMLLAALTDGLGVSSGSAQATIPGAVVFRPNAGTVIRPDSGTVFRPDIGIVNHVLTVVARIFTGTVLRP